MNNYRLLNGYIIFTAAVIFITTACAGSQRNVLSTERDFQEAFNKVYFNSKAKLEAPVKYGRVDLLSDDYAIEVDKLDNFHEALGQALHYAKETGRKPAVAIFILERKPGDREKVKFVMELCNYYGIKFWFLNEELKKGNKK